MDFTTTRRSLMFGVAGSSFAVRTDRRRSTHRVHRYWHRGKSLVPQVLEQRNTRVTAICDVDPNARDAGLTLAKRDSPRPFTDWRAMLDFKDIDAVVIATPCYLHAEMAAAALAGRQVRVLRKADGHHAGAGPTGAECIARRQNVLADRAAAPLLSVVREAVRQVHRATCWAARSVIKAQRDSLRPSPEEAQAKRPAWYKDVRYSGDLIVENAIHNIDVCNWIANSRPVTAFGHGMKYFPQPRWAGQGNDGRLQRRVRLSQRNPPGLQPALHASARSAQDDERTVVRRFIGQKGALDMTHESAEFYEMNSTEPRDIIPASLKSGKENAMEEFFACIRENRRPFADVQVGATAALTTIMGREAIYSGER